MATYLPNVTDVLPDPSLYTPNFSYMDTMLRRRQAMYEQGFAQISSAYSNIARNVTNPVNAQVRDQFLREAQMNLKNLAAADLSQRQNVAAATDVFKPFYSNRDVLGDMAVTSYWDQQEQIAESYRLRDGGKEFSEDNLRDIQLQRQQFAQDDPSKWQMYYSNRRGYTPYYNYDKEVQEAMKNFKPRRTPILDKNGVYITTGVDQSWYQEDLQRYLSGVLSEKAKQQMGIEARVRFGSNPQALASLYSQEAASTLPALDNNIEQLQRKFDAASKPDLKKMYEEELEFYKDQRNQMRQNLEAIKNGDMNFLMNNQTGMANRLYMNSKIRGWSQAYAHEDKELKLDFDDYLITQFKEQQANYRARLHEQEANKRALLSKKDDDESIKGDVVETGVPAIEASEETKASLNQEIKGKRQLLMAQHNDLKAHIAMLDVNKGKTASDITDAEVEVYIKENPTDRKAFEYVKLGDQIRSDEDNLKTMTSKDQAFIKNRLGSVRYRQFQALEQARQNATNNTNSSTTSQPVRFNPLGNVRSSDIGTRVRGNTDQVNARLFESSIYVAGQTMGLSKDDVDKLYSDVNAAKESFKRQPKGVAVTRTGATIRSDSPLYKRTADILAQTSGIQKDNITGIQYVTTPAGIDLYINIGKGTKSNPTDYEAIKNNLVVRYGVQNVTVDEKTGLVYVPKVGSTINPELDPYKNIDPSDRKYLLQLDEAEGLPGTTYDKKFFVRDRSGKNRVFTITKSFSSDPSNDGYYLYGPSGRPFQGQRFDTPLNAYATLASILNEPSVNVDRLFEQPK